MPPKKKEEKPKTVLMGRFSNNLKMGIVGLPNVGKSTFFNTLTKLNVPALNYPFCTIDPNEARVPVPDDRFDWLCNFHKPASKVSASLQIWDIAGLVKGASSGAGLGNAFLSNINSVDGIFHVVRLFEDEEVTHVEGTVDPVRDLDIISTELRLKDAERLGGILEELEGRVKRSGAKTPKEMRAELEALQKAQKVMADGRPLRCAEWTAAEIEFLNRHLFLTAKPAIYLLNLTEDEYIKKKNKWLGKVKAWVDQTDGGTIIPFSASLEAKLVELELGEGGPQAAMAYLSEKGTMSALPKITKTGFSTLNLIYFFTAGPDEVKCWNIRQGTLAPQAAGTIHTDFEKGFICAEIMKFEDFKEHGSDNAVRAAGKYKQKGRDYVVEDGDIIFFKFNVTTQPAKKK